MISGVASNFRNVSLAAAEVLQQRLARRADVDVPLAADGIDLKSAHFHVYH